MCGICGVLTLDDVQPDASTLEPMLRRMVHRGPDADGQFVAPGVAAGMTRLAVIDVAGGDQPLANEDGDVQVVFNGEIYNHVELRRELEGRGHRFRTRSDTEVLVHLWEEAGPEMVHRLNGMFAFCLHDRTRGETLLARDRLGIKPLFYVEQGQRLYFASEPAVLLAHPDVDLTPDPAALVELFFLQYAAGDRSVWRGMRKLMPGELIHQRRGGRTSRRYWSWPGEVPAALPGPREQVEQLHELLDSSVRMRTVADVPLGAFLSGGLDSTVITQLLAAASDHAVRTYSVGFDGPEAFDERSYARLVAEHLGTEHHELVVSAMEIAEHLPRMVEHLAEPVTDPAMLPTYLLSGFARQEVTVVLSGEGADELFGGYRRYLYQNRYGWIGHVPGLAGMAASELARLLPRRVAQAAAAVGHREPARGHLEWSSTTGSRLAGGLFERSLVEQVVDRLAAGFEGYFSSTGSLLAGQLAADQQEWLPHNLLAKVDRASMAHSLEARVPFLDHRVVEFAAGLPDEARIRGNTGKVLLRQAYGDVLPPQIRDRPKQGFDLPLADWIRGPLRSMAGDLLAGSTPGRWPGLDVVGARRLLAEHLAGTQDHGLPLFCMISTLLFLDGQRRRSAS